MHTREVTTNTAAGQLADEPQSAERIGVVCGPATLFHILAFVFAFILAIVLEVVLALILSFILVSILSGILSGILALVLTVVLAIVLTVVLTIVLSVALQTAVRFFLLPGSRLVTYSLVVRTAHANFLATTGLVRRVCGVVLVLFRLSAIKSMQKGHRSTYTTENRSQQRQVAQITSE
jgi:lysylphosphatidylglycerol synthetase-like protein (DUF2156 family)